MAMRANWCIAVRVLCWTESIAWILSCSDGETVARPGLGDSNKNVDEAQVWNCTKSVLRFIKQRETSPKDGVSLENYSETSSLEDQRHVCGWALRGHRCWRAMRALVPVRAAARRSGEQGAC